MASQRDAALGALVRKYRGTLTQAAVAELVSHEIGERVTQGMVSDHENGRRWRNNSDLPGAYARALRIPQAEVIAALGFSSSEDEPPQTFAQIVRNDPTLSRAAKEHLLNQYHLLQLASAQERAGHPILSEIPTEDEDEGPGRASG